MEKHTTKRGPGRIHENGTHRNGKTKSMGFADAVMNSAAKKRAGAMKFFGLRDKHGAFTLTGKPIVRPRRIWLAGISAQRGY